MASVKNFMVVAVIVGFFIYLVFILTTVVGNLLYNPDDGLATELDELAQDDMTGEYKDRWNEYHSADDDSFGFIMLLLFGVLYLVLVIVAFKKKGEQDQ